MWLTCCSLFYSAGQHVLLCPTLQAPFTHTMTGENSEVMEEEPLMNRAMQRRSKYLRAVRSYLALSLTILVMLCALLLHGGWSPCWV
jgi:hypothetical protein